MKLTPRKRFLSTNRCIYTRNIIDACDPQAKSSYEHIIPLSLGGTNQFTTNDVRVDSNNRAGSEIDDTVAQLLPFIMLRQRYKLVGNRKTVPSVKLRGEFIDIDAAARLEITASGDIEVGFENEQSSSGKIINLHTSAERLKVLLKARLVQAQSRKMHLMTPFGKIKDEEDIDIAIMLGNGAEAKQFKASIVLDMKEMHFALSRLMIKIAIGLGHRVLGPEWTFGPGAQKLQNQLFRKSSEKTRSRINGSINADLPENMKVIFGLLEADRHVFAVLPSGKTCTAVISLFGGEVGTAVIDLGYDMRRKLNRALNANTPFNCVFSIPLRTAGSRPLETKSIQEISFIADQNGLLPASRAAAQSEANARRASKP